jgi:Amt family ammonium transporter
MRSFSQFPSRFPQFSAIVAVFLLLGGSLHAEGIDSGDTAWISAATALVLFMTLPGLALFYGGLVRDRNVLSVLMHCFAIACVMTLVWVVAGYSLAFSGEGKFIGNLDQMFLKNFDWSAALDGTGIPNILFFMFQMTFFIITPALIIGTFVERIKFSAMMVFVILWSLLVYAPVCHMVWDSDGWMFQRGAIDLAGGIVVHITAGFAALLACIMIGPRKSAKPPHNLVLTLTGTCMLWVGWFGFNGGSGLAANAAAAMSITVTHISAATAACTWAAIEWFGHTKKPSVLGIATGSIAGLAAITPAAGVAGPMGAILIGFVSGAVCFWFSVKLKNKFGYDDSLDVFGVHGVGGLLGTILAAVVGLKAFGGVADEFDFGTQMVTQLIASGFTIVFTLVVTFVILKLVDVTIGLRVDENAEVVGLDQASHGENAYND